VTARSLRSGQRRGFGYPAQTLVRIESEGPVTTVILDRAGAKNAVDRETAEQLAAAFRAFDADPAARVAVLYGDHGTFCAGADLKSIAAGRGLRFERDGDGPMGPSRMLLGKPVIAAIAGHAVAGGLELALWCDLRIADEDAVLGVFCRRFGVPLVDGGTIRLPRLIGLSRALDLILTGRPVRADEALAIGLVNRVVPRGESLARARQLAHQLAELPQTAMRADRMSAYLQYNLSLEDALANEHELGAHAVLEGFEGARRFAAGAGRHGEPT
jgi:enoyl-CoA hydratase